MKVKGNPIEIKNIYIQLALIFLIFATSLLADSLNYALLALIGVIVALGFWYIKMDKRQEKIFEDYQIILISLIIILGFFIRLNNLGDPSLWVDEATTSNAAISLLENGKPILNSGFTYWRALPHTILTSMSIEVYGKSDFAVRFPSVITGTLTIFLTYLTGKKFFDTDIGIIAALIVSLSSWEIIWSKQARMYSLFQLLYLSSIFLIYITERKPTLKKYLALCITVTLSVLTHITAYILPLVIIGYFTYSKYIENKEKISYRIFSIPVVLIVLFQLLDQSFLNIINRLSFNPENISAYISWLSANAPGLFLFGLAGLSVGIKEKRKINLLMIGSTAPILYIYFLHYSMAASRYIYVVIPFFAIWSSVLVVKVSNNFKKNLETKKILLIILLGFLISGNFISGEYRPGLHAPQPDFKSAYNYVEENRRKESIVITKWTSPAVYYLDRPPEYALVGTYPPKSDRIFNGSERYSGAEFIDNSSELRSIIEKHESGWIVLDIRAWNGLRVETQRIIEDLNQRKHLHEIKVWRWN